MLMNNLLKRFLSLCLFIEGSFIELCAEPRGRGYDPDAPNLGLPEGKTVLIGLIIAIIAIPVGYFINSASTSSDSSNDSVFPGCIGTLLIIGGAICLLPLIAWIFTALSAIYAIGIVIVAIIIIIGLFSSKD